LPGEPRFVYLVLSHRDASQVQRLCRAILALSPVARIVVAHDVHASAPPDVSDWDRVSLSERGPSKWGSYQLVSDVFDAFEAIETDGDYEWVVTISGQCFPVVDLAAWERHVADSRAHALVLQFGGIGDGRLRFGRRRSAGNRRLSRYTHNHWHLPPVLPSRDGPLRRFYRRVLQRIAVNLSPIVDYTGHPDGGSVIGVRRVHQPIPDSWPPIAGSQWNAVDREALQHLLAVSRSRQVSRAWKKTHIPDEGMIPSILHAAEHLVVVDRPVSSALFEPLNNRHPVTVTPERLDELEALARASGAPFLRKFDQAIAGTLDEMERRIREVHVANDASRIACVENGGAT
jgi:hypothetical protein